MNKMTKEEFDAFHERNRVMAEEALKQRGRLPASFGERKESVPSLRDVYAQKKIELDNEMEARQEQIKASEHSLEKRWPIEKLPPTNPRRKAALLNQINHGEASEIDVLKAENEKLKADFDTLAGAIAKLQ